MGKSRPEAGRLFRLSDSPVIVVKQLDGHVAAPPSMPGFEYLSETPGGDRSPGLQAGVADRHGELTAGHTSLEEEEENNSADKNKIKTGICTINTAPGCY